MFTQAPKKWIKFNFILLKNFKSILLIYRITYDISCGKCLIISVNRSCVFLFTSEQNTQLMADWRCLNAPTDLIFKILLCGHIDIRQEICNTRENPICIFGRISCVRPRPRWQRTRTDKSTLASRPYYYSRGDRPSLASAKIYES